MPTATNLLKTISFQIHHQIPNSETTFLPNLLLRNHSKTTTSPFLSSFSCPKTAFHHGGSKISAVLETKLDSTDQSATIPPVPVRIVALVGEGSISPLKSAPWMEVMLHTANRLKWVDEGYEMEVYSDKLCQLDSEESKKLQRKLSETDILMVVAITDMQSITWVKTNSQKIPNVVCFDSSPALTNKLGGVSVNTEEKKVGFFSKLSRIGQEENSDESKEVVKTVAEAWERHNSDDIRFCILVIINTYIRPVEILNNLRSKGLSTLKCMATNCGPQILNCLLDPNCRKALQCLNNCSPVDQVCNYRCIASYESPNLEAFSLCVLQKHNCLELDAKIPEKPFVPPMVKFRGEDLCHETAEDLFVGWLGIWTGVGVSLQGKTRLMISSHVSISCFIEGKQEVKTLEEGNLVWRRRRYRVKRAKVPGTFNFSVLDNGVVSNEFWTVVDVADDLSWGLFHYSGAARVAGQSYTGAVLVSPDGEYPNEKEKEKLVSALEKCGIKEWELFMVDNCSCENAPLGIPDGSSLHRKIEVKHEVKDTQ
ncbi:hypothetical protein MKW92_038994 [Papaver armeniacum]|nr:hypothetical protein MKW92_038994 [Papaver armeniacum]